MGQFNITIAFHDHKQNVPIQVLKGNHGSLLSYSTAKALGIVDLRVRHITSPPDKLSPKFPTLFQGIGKLKDVEVKLYINQTVTPVAQ